MYDASKARFIQEDTYAGNNKDPLSFNLYTYANNNPLKDYDPTGHSAEILDTAQMNAEIYKDSGLFANPEQFRRAQSIRNAEVVTKMDSQVGEVTIKIK